MIDVGIKLETEVIIQDRLLSQFKSFKISTIVGYIFAEDLDRCGDIIYRESIKGDKYPNTFKIIGVDNNSTNRLQVMVNPTKHDYTYTISLEELNDIMSDGSIEYSIDKVDEVLVDRLLEYLYASH